MIYSWYDDGNFENMLIRVMSGPKFGLTKWTCEFSLCVPALWKRRGRKALPIPPWHTVERRYQVRLLNAVGAENRITKTVVTSPGHTPWRIYREAHHTLRDQWWSIACHYQTINLFSTLKILPMVVILGLRSCYDEVKKRIGIRDIPCFWPAKTLIPHGDFHRKM